MLSLSGWASLSAASDTTPVASDIGRAIALENELTQVCTEIKRKEARAFMRTVIWPLYSEFETRGGTEARTVTRTWKNRQLQITVTPIPPRSQPTFTLFDATTRSEISVANLIYQTLDHRRCADFPLSVSEASIFAITAPPQERQAAEGMDEIQQILRSLTPDAGAATRRAAREAQIRGDRRISADPAAPPGAPGSAPETAVVPQAPAR